MVNSASHGAIIGRWYDEALLTSVMQIARGVLEAFVPFGHIVNASLDTGATFYNLYNNATLSSLIGPDEPHKNPRYPFIFKVLYLV